MKNTKTIKTTFAIIAVFAFVTTIGITSVFATHVSGVEDYEWHIWSRSSGDGHTSYLNCGTGSQSDNCDLKIKTLSTSIQGITQSTINTQVNSIESVFDSLGKKMSIDRVTTADSHITGYNLPIGQPGRADYEMHCTNFFIWCQSYDSHFVKMKVYANDNASEIKFKTIENGNANPKEYDIRKTLTHELYHAMGIDHNAGSNSVVYYLYQFGANGYNPSTTDRNDLGARYP